MSNQNTFRYNNKTNASVVLKSKLLCDFEQNFCVNIDEIINLVPVATFAELLIRLRIPGISGIIYLAGGTFTATETADIPANVSLVGVGAETLFVVNSNIGTLFNIEGSNVSLKNFNVNMNSTAGTNCIATTSSVSNILISGLTILDTALTQFAIELNGTSCSDITITNCSIDGNGDGIDINNSSNVNINNSTFYNIQAYTITLNTISDIIITNNLGDSAGTIYISECSNCIITNNIFTNCVVQGIVMAISNNNDIIINGNQFNMSEDYNIIVLQSVMNNININSNILDNPIGTESTIGLPTATATLQNIAIMDNTQVGTSSQYFFLTTTPQSNVYSDVMIRNTVKRLTVSGATAGQLGTLASAQLSYVRLTPSALVTGTLLSQVRGPTFNRVYITNTVGSGFNITFNAANCTGSPDTAFFPAVNTLIPNHYMVFIWSGYSYVLELLV